MATYVLVHGAGSDAWYWHLVGPRLEGRGHEVVAVDLPCDDDGAGLREYADVVVAAADGRGEVIVVAQSLGGFTAPLVCDRLPVALLVLVAAMTPRPGEAPGEWWANTGHRFPEPFDPAEVFTHDLPPDLAAAALEHARDPVRPALRGPVAPERLARRADPVPPVPRRPSAKHPGQGDRFFPADFQRRVQAERLGIVPDEMDGGHLPALARPDELVERLESFRRSLDGAGDSAADAAASGAETRTSALRSRST